MLLWAKNEVPLNLNKLSKFKCRANSLVYCHPNCLPQSYLYIIYIYIYRRFWVSSSFSTICPVYIYIYCTYWYGANSMYISEYTLWHVVYCHPSHSENHFIWYLNLYKPLLLDWWPSPNPCSPAVAPSISEFVCREKYHVCLFVGFTTYVYRSHRRRYTHTYTHALYIKLCVICT